MYNRYNEETKVPKEVKLKMVFPYFKTVDYQLYFI